MSVTFPSPPDKKQEIEENKELDVNAEENKELNDVKENKIENVKKDEDVKPVLKKIEEKFFKNESIEPSKFLFFNFKNKNERNVFVSFLIPPIVISIISMIHITSFFELTNSTVLSWLLSSAFEFASISALFALSALSRINKNTIWSLFFSIVILQIVGNVYHSYININPQDPNLLKLLSILEINVGNLPLTLQIIGIIQGAILPLVSLTFIKSIVEYMKFENENK